MSQIIAPLQAKVSVEITGEQFVAVCKIQAAENAADRELVREAVQQLGVTFAGYLTLLSSRENRRAEEARAESLAHQVRLAEINKPEPKARRSAKKAAPSYMNGVDLD